MRTKIAWQGLGLLSSGSSVTTSPFFGVLHFFPAIPYQTDCAGTSASQSVQWTSCQTGKTTTWISVLRLTQTQTCNSALKAIAAAPFPGAALIVNVQLWGKRQPNVRISSSESNVVDWLKCSHWFDWWLFLWNSNYEPVVMERGDPWKSSNDVYEAQKSRHDTRKFY